MQIIIIVTLLFKLAYATYSDLNYDDCLHTESNLVSAPCRDVVAIDDAIPSEIAQNITVIITEGGAASNMNGMWVGSLSGVGGGKGYWILSDMEGCFNYTCSEN